MRGNLAVIAAAFAALIVGILIGHVAASGEADVSAERLAEARADRDHSREVARALRRELSRAEGRAKEAAAASTPPEPKPTAKPRPKPKPQPVRVGDGTYLVGEDIPAGTYVSPGGRLDGAPCVAFASTEPGDLGTWLRGNTSEGQNIVKVSAGEYFSVQYCRPFVRQR